MSDWNKEHILPLILKAGAMALETFEKVEIQLKADASLVTQADVAIENMLKETLERPDEGVFVVGEESIGEKSDEYMLNCLTQKAYVVDPIDGTANYANGLTMWGVSIGYMEAGVLKDGAIYLPLHHELYITDGDDVLLYSVFDGKISDPRILKTPVRTPDALGIVSVTQKMTKRFRLGGKAGVHCCGAAVYAITNVIRGRNIAYFGKIKLWDIAAGLPMLFRLGLEATLMNGTRISGAVIEEIYRLDPQQDGRFSMRDVVVLCQDGEFKLVLENLNPREIGK
jgi:myo-inositol-1(or 4)-monophosphatase